MQIVAAFPLPAKNLSFRRRLCDVRFFKVLKVFGAIICGIALLFVIVALMRWNAPPLRTANDGSKLSVDVRTLGEYQTTIARIRLSDLTSGVVVWELRSNDTAQIRGFTLSDGENAAQIHADYGSYRIIMPSGSSKFLLRKSTRYKLELWGGSTILSKQSTSFSFADSP